MTHIKKENRNNENGCVDKEIRKPEIRIFPNSKAKEFGTKDKLVEYLRDGFYPKGTGIYYFRSYRQVKCIPGNSWALFRFEDLILGCAKIKEPAVFKKNAGPNQEYEGQITFEVTSTRVFNPPLEIGRLEKLTGEKYHNDDNLKTGRAYYIVSKKHHDKVLELLGVD